MFNRSKIFITLSLMLMMVLLPACAAQTTPAAENAQAESEEAHSEEDHHDEEEGHHDDHGDEHAVELSAVNLGDGEKLQVVATTNIVGDMVQQVGGDLIELTTMLPVGADPHSFAPTPGDAASVADAHVVFVNGLNLEEFLEELIENAGGEAPIIALSSNVETREFGEMGGHGHHDEKEGEHHDDDEHHDDEEGEHHDDDDDEHHDDEEGEHHDDEEGEHHDDDDEHHDDEEGEHHDDEEGEHHDEHGHHGHDHSGDDPHVWMTPANAMMMVHTIEHALSELDPANAETYEANAEAYEAQLEELDTWVMAQIETIPAENREMVTDHDAFGYYADRYGLEVVGAVLPSYSTNAEPSAQELAELLEAIGVFDVKAIFVGTTVNPVLAERISEDTGIQLVPLYTGSLGEADSGADNYLDYIRYNTTAIVEALQ
ncbi:MAG: zinc ABC transporter substrate-binding protein [Chloroflexota bacterium]